MNTILAHFSRQKLNQADYLNHKSHTTIHDKDTLHSASKQDNIFITEDFILLLSGNIYNHPASQTAISWIASLYKKYNTKCFDHIEGIYSIVITDTKAQKVYFARDRVGAKKLYYYLDQKQLIISDKLETLFMPKTIQKRISYSGVSNYFNFGFLLDPESIYQDCKKVKAGHFICIDLKTMQKTSTLFWSLQECYDHPKDSKSEQEILTLSESLLQKSIQKRIPKSTDYGAFLSGGYDSATITAMLKQYTPDLQTFTIGFKQQEIDEAPYANAIAKHLGTKHTQYYFSDADALKIIPDLSEVYEEPFADYGATPSVMLAQIAKGAGINTLFGGDGGDEVFATADDIYRIEKLLHIPYNIRKNIARLIKITHPSHYLPLQYDTPLATKITKAADTLQAKTITKIIKSRMTLFTDEALFELLKHPLFCYKTPFDNLTFGKYAQTSDIITGSYFNSFLRDGELTKVSGALDYHDISMRNPFLDKELISFMATIPQELKLKNGIKKYLLKEIAHRYIPKELLNRPKMGFDIPFSYWMSGVLKELLIDTLNSESIQKNEILKQKEVIRIRDAFLNSKKEYKYKLWSIFLYQLWHNRHFS